MHLHRHLGTNTDRTVQLYVHRQFVPAGQLPERVDQTRVARSLRRFDHDVVNVTNDRLMQVNDDAQNAR